MRKFLPPFCRHWWAILMSKECFSFFDIFCIENERELTSASWEGEMYEGKLTLWGFLKRKEIYAGFFILKISIFRTKISQLFFLSLWRLHYNWNSFNYFLIVIMYSYIIEEYKNKYSWTAINKLIETHESIC